MRSADSIGRKFLHTALLIASALLLLSVLLSCIPEIQRKSYVAKAPDVEITPLPPMHPFWLLNSGDKDALDELPGIGEVIAGRIIENRNADGPFYFPEDIMEVKGIGLKTMQLINEWLREHPERAYIFPE